jgi:hypothetical protein
MTRIFSTFSVLALLSLSAFGADQKGTDDTLFADGHTDQMRMKKEKGSPRTAYRRSGERNAIRKKGQLRGGPATMSGTDSTDLDSTSHDDAHTSATPGASSSTGTSGNKAGDTGGNTPGGGSKGGSASDSGPGGQDL